MRALRPAMLVWLAAAAAPACAQVPCSRPVGPDLIISDITGSNSYPASGGRSAFSVGTRQTNVGNALVNYFASLPAHPVEGLALYRLSTASGPARFEEIGQSWLLHGLFALSQNNPCDTCQASDGSHLGVGCSSPDSASALGGQSGLGPRWQVNPHTGSFTYPPASPPFAGSVARRLQASTADILPGAAYSYFVEVHAIAADDAAAGNGDNNASYRPCTISVISTPYNLQLSGATVPEQPAISAWKAADPLVTQSTVHAPGDGAFIVSSRATDLGNGMWHYEYAVYNMNCDAGAGQFSVPLSVFAALSNTGFHDVDYTDGDGVNSVSRDGTEWPTSRLFGSLGWFTPDYASNPNGNGLLWGTLYNFRFDTDAPPAASGSAQITLWKSPGVVLSVPAQVPSVSGCYANCDGSALTPVLNVNDFVCFASAFAAQEAYANCDGSTAPPVLSVNDFVCFQAVFAAGCM